MFIYSRSLKLLVAGLYFTVVLTASLFHTHDCGGRCATHCHSQIDSSSHTHIGNSCSCSCCHQESATHTEEKPASTPTVKPCSPFKSDLSGEHFCPICSFLAQKPIASTCITVPTWLPLCGERAENVELTFLPPVSLPWLSRAPPLVA